MHDKAQKNNIISYDFLNMYQKSQNSTFITLYDLI